MNRPTVAPKRRHRLAKAELGELSNDTGLSSIVLADYASGYIDLPEASARRVEASIADLGLGSSTKPSNGAVALMLPDLTAPYFAQMAQCVEGAALDVGWDLLIALTGNDVKREIRVLSRLSIHDLAGVLIFSNNGADERLVNALACRDDVVALAEKIPSSAVHSVVSDLNSAAGLAATHLKGLGHRSFAFIGGSPFAPSTRQLAAAFGLEVLPRVREPSDYVECLGTHTEGHGYRTVLRLWSEARLPTAILAGSSAIAEGVLRAASELALNIPEDISMIAFDGSGPMDLMEPPVTTISVGMPLLAQRGVALLRHSRRGQARSVIEKIPVELLVRKSTHRPSLFDLLGPPTAT